MSSQVKAPAPCTKPDRDCEATTGQPIRLYSGRILLDETDIDIGVPGFGHQRSFLNMNYELENWDGPQGWNWAISEWPYLVQRINSFGNESIVLKNGFFPIWFDVGASGIVARYGHQVRHTLKAVPAENILRYIKYTDGGVAEIIDFMTLTSRTASPA